MRFQVSVIFALFSAPFVACNEPFHDASNSVVGKNLREVASLSSTAADVMETNDPDTMEQAWPHRELQITEACDASLQELYTNEALNETYNAYIEASDAALANLGNTSIESCVSTGETSLTCDFSPPIDGEEEFTSACTAAGGEILSVSLDLSCSGTLNGTAGTLLIDMPTMLDCIPSSPDFASCEDTIRELYQNVTDFYESFAEKTLLFFGIDDASCTAADAGGDTGGSDNGGGDSGGSGGDDSEDGGSSGGSDNGSGSSNASSLSLLISFGVVAIISLTFG